MLKNVQLLPKTKWLRTIFVLILSSIFNISVFAGNTYTLTDTTISFSYNSYSSDIDEDKIPDYWRGTLENVFSQATGDNAWTPINSEKFSITLTGTADFSGNVKVYMVDTRADVGYWTQLSQNVFSFDVVVGEEFSQTMEFTIDRTKYNGYTLLPNMIFEALPTTTSTKEGFDNTKKFSLTFDEFDITYIPLTTTLSYYTYNADTDGDEISDYWRGTFDDIFSQATGNDAWTPNIGEKFTITLSGTADFSGNVKVYMADTREEAVYWKTLCDDFLSFDVVKGETFSTTFTFTITNTDFNGYTLLPNMIFDALPTITSTKEDFDNTKKYSLTFDTFRIKYTPRTTCTLSYNTYSSDTDEDKIPDYWQGTLENVFSQATGDDSWEPSYGEHFSVTLTGTADFSGNVKVYMVDTRADAGYWTQLSQDVFSFDVVEGEEFSQAMEFTIDRTKYNDFTLVPNMVFEALPTTTSTMDGFDNTKAFSITFNTFDVVYSLPIAILYYGWIDTDGDKISDEWVGNIFNTRKKLTEATGKDTLKLNIGDKYTITFKGKADFNGSIKTSIVDASKEANYWTLLSQDTPSFDVVKGEEFSQTIKFTITQTTIDDYTLKPTQIHFDVYPTITSTMEEFDSTEVYSLVLNQIDVAYTYSPIPEIHPENYSQTFELNHKSSSDDINSDEIGDIWSYKQSVLQPVLDKGFDYLDVFMDDKFIVHFKGVAAFTGNIEMYIRPIKWDEKRSTVKEFAVKYGEEFEINDTLVINNGVWSEPYLQIDAICDDNSYPEIKYMYVNDYSVSYMYRIIPEYYSTCIRLTNYNYGFADINGDGKDDSWDSEYDPSQIIQNQGYQMSDVADGDKLIVHFNGIADFTGKLFVYIMDDTDWHVCSSVIEHAIEYGKIFEINDTLVIKDVSQHITIRMDAECDDTLYPKYKYLYSNDFVVSYSSQFCKVVVNCKDVTSVYSLWSSEKEAFDIDAYSRIQIENLDKQYIIPENLNVVFTLPKGSQVTIKANTNHDGYLDEFYSWNDGTSDTIKTITVPDTDSLVLTANFRATEWIKEGSYSCRQMNMRALDTVSIYLPEISHSSYGSPLTYTIEHEDSLVVTKLSNDTLYFMPPVETTGEMLDMWIKASIPNGKSCIIEFASNTNPRRTNTILRDSLYPTPKISLVTVSQETGKNLVVWQKFETDKIDHYNIYRESEVAGEYKKIAEVPYSETSIYEDTEADPLVRAWRYKISASPVDTRYTESDQSIAHKTIHLTKNLGMNNAYNLIWDNYEGMDFSTFVVIRNYKVGTNVVTDTIAEIPSNVNSYTDLEPQKRTISYYVAIKLNEPVDPNEYLKSESGPFSLALSNIAEIENSEESTRINDIESDVIVYAIHNTIYVKNATAQAKVYNIESELVAQSQSNSEIQEITIEKAGVYFVKVANSLYKVIIF